jgi:hypothetical protein
MTYDDHPSLERLAEWDEGLLPVDEADAVSAHVGGCPDCPRALDDLRGVSALLGTRAGIGSVPDDVAARLDAALAAPQDRSAAMTPIRAAQSAPTAGTGRRRRPARRWHELPVLRAAAAVLVVGGGISLLGQVVTGADGDDSADVTAGTLSAEDENAEGAAGSQLAPDVGSEQDAADAGRTADASAVLLSRSGRDHGVDDLSDAGRRMVAGAPPYVPDPTAVDAQSVQACTDSLEAPPLALDVSSFDGATAWLAVVADDEDPAAVFVYVLPPGCPPGELRYVERVSLDGSRAP